MASRTPRLLPHVRCAAVAILALLVVAPMSVLAHATLVTSDPANGATLTVAPVTVSATYAEAFDTSRSSMALLGPDGATIATSQRSGTATATSMTISGFATLAAGTYSVQWTTITPDDNGIERGTFTFTVAPEAAAGDATPSPAAAATAGAAASPGGGGTASSGGAGDIVVPLVVLLAVVGVGLAWFLRRAR